MDCYKSLCTQFYDIDKPTAPKKELDFYLRYARRARGPILEPMCGSGRFLVPIAQAGFDIDGFDASPHMLAACRAKLKKLRLKSGVSEQSLPDVKLARKYALVLIPAGSFGLITDERAIRASVKRLHDALMPGGTIVIELDAYTRAASGSWPWGGRWIRRDDGARLIISWLGRFDAAASIESSLHRYELIDRSGRLRKTEIEEFNLRRIPRPQMTRWLRDSGFACSKVVRDDDQTMIFEARRATRV